MADHLGLSQSMVSRVWRAFGLAPAQRIRGSCPQDPMFVEKVRDVVGLYMNPPEHAVVLCVDEKTQYPSTRSGTQPSLPMLPGIPARPTHDYVRHGRLDLFATLDLTTGQVVARRIPAIAPTSSSRSCGDRHRVPDDLDVMSCSQLLHPQDPHRTSLGYATRGSSFTSPPPAPPGSTSWSAGSRNDPQEAAPLHPHHRRHSTPHLATGSTPGTTTPAPTSGPRPPIKSSPHRKYCLRIDDSRH